MAKQKVSRKVTFQGQPYSMDNWLRQNLDHMKEAVKYDWDFIIVVDGTEGGGKSTLAIQCACYLDPTFEMKRIVFSPEDFEETVIKAEKYQAVIYDEAVTGLYSRESMQFVNVALTKLLAQIRQKNLFIFVVIPTFFDLDKYVAMWRSRALLHVFTDGFTRGRFRFYSAGKKKSLYANGKQFYNYKHPLPDFYGRYPKFNPFYEEYKKKKQKSLEERQDAQANPFAQRDRAVRILYQKHGWKQREIADLFGATQQNISIVLRRYGTVTNKQQKMNENERKSRSKRRS